MKYITASLSRYWLWKFYLGFFFFPSQSILWAALLFSFCTNFWNNALIWFCYAVLSGRMRNSVLPQKLCIILSLSSVFIFSIMSDAKYLNRRLFQDAYFSESYINIKIIQWRIHFYMLLAFAFQKPKGFPEGYACLHLFSL